MVGSTDNIQGPLTIELYHAVLNSDVKEVTRLINAGVDVNCFAIEDGHIPDGWDVPSPLSSILHFAALIGSLDVIKNLLKKGANVGAIDYSTQTPLMTYVDCSSKFTDKVIKEFVMHGSSIHHTDFCGRSSLYYSLDKTEMVDLECCKALLKYDLFKNYKQNFRAIKKIFETKGRNYSDIADYLKNCKAEILQMKRNRINEYLSLHELLLLNFFDKNHRDTESDYTLYLLRLIDKGNYSIYSDILLDCIKPNYLVSNLTKTEIYTPGCAEKRKVILHPDTIYHLSTFLSKDDLINLLKAFHAVYFNSNQCSDLTKFSDSELSVCSFSSLCHLRNGTYLYNKSCIEIPSNKTCKPKSGSVQSLDSSKHKPSIPAEMIRMKSHSDVLLNNTMNPRRSVRLQRKRSSPYSRKSCLRQKKL